VAVRVGGWGQLLGDEGSGYDIALQGLRAVARAADGRATDTALTAALLAAAQRREPDDLIAWSAVATKAQIAALAPHVLTCAAQGDAAAVSIRAGAVHALVHMALTAARRTAADSVTFALTGGLLADDGPLRTHVIRSLHEHRPQARIADHPVDAALGAARLARALRDS
jgi:N-acetylglucosamine kinase-like BadF-type ATPase